MRHMLALIPVTVVLVACSGGNDEPDAASIETGETVEAWQEAATGPEGRVTGDAAAYAAMSARLGDAWLDQFGDAVSADTLALRHRSALRSHQDDIAELMRLAAIDSLDFGVRTEDGIDMLLPHLFPMRKFVKMLRADALRLAEAGESDAAADRLAAIVGMARQVRSDRLVLSTLVGAANLAVVFETTNELIDRDQLSRDASVRLADALKRVDVDNPIGAREALLHSLDVTAYSVRNGMYHPDGDWAFIASLSELQRRDGADEIERLKLAVAASWDERDAPALLQELQNRAQTRSAFLAISGLDAYRKQISRTGRDLQSQLRKLESLGGP